MSLRIRFVVLIWLAILSLFNLFGSGSTSRITFENGRYNEILIAIHRNNNPNECTKIIESLTEMLKEAGTILYDATNGEASFGSINILIPADWNLQTECSIQKTVLNEARLFHTYDAADFKIPSMDHPIAKSLPWTKQYKQCQHEAETLYLPVDFLTRSDFSLELRGKLLIHEWAKFRYGVFEEFGYFDDPIFSPCYTRGGNQYFTSCADSSTSHMNTNNPPPISPEACRMLISENSEALTAELRQATSSLMFAPNFDNIKKPCETATHNGLSPTKQNIFCERKSVSDVISSHQDFKSLLSDRVFPNNRVPRPSSSPQINVIQHNFIKDPGYVFVIEDTEDIRQFRRLDHVKQGIAELVRLAADKSSVALYRYNGDVFSVIDEKKLGDEGNRRNFLNVVPSTTSSVPIFSGRARNRSTKKFNTLETPLDFTFRNVLALLRSNVEWNIILVTSQPPKNVVQAINSIKLSDFSLSILTFDTSRDWLQFYTIPNTKEVIFLPHCYTNGEVCHGKTSSLIGDHLLQLVGQEEERSLHKVVDINIKDPSGTFNIGNLVDGGENFTFHLPVYHNLIDLTVKPVASQNRCTASQILSYYGILETVRGQCPYQTGNWEYEIRNHPAGVPINYNLRAFVERIGKGRDLIITSTMGQKLETEFRPTRSPYPIYVSVMSTNEHPIIGAIVELETDYEGKSFENSNTILLHDDGIDPDLTADDGVYSAYLTKFNPDASYHTVQVRVQTKSGQSKVIESLRSDTFEAALLDPRMSPKCCGSKIPYATTIDAGTSYYTLTLPSFRTGEFVDSEKIPPSKIHSAITLVEDNGDNILYEFLAPGGNNNVGAVRQYNICCTPSVSGNLDDSMCHPIEAQNCFPEEAGKKQECRVYRADLITNYFSQTNPEPGATLYCGFQGVNHAGIFGPISSHLVEIVVTDTGSQSTECVSISDGCLPIEVFWGLIACVGGLILILFIVLICWCFTTRDRKINKEKMNDKKSSMYISGGPRRSSSPVPEDLRNVYINQAYIQDSNGHLRLVASDGQLYPTSGNAETESNNRLGSSQADTMGVRRRSISANDVSQGITPVSFPNGNNGTTAKQVSWNANPVSVDSSPKHVSWNANPVSADPNPKPVPWNANSVPPNPEIDDKDRDMPVFFSNRPPTGISTVPITRPASGSTLPHHSRHESIDSLNDRRNTTPPKENNQFQTHHNTNLNRRPNGARNPILTNDSEPPVYASVQRFARKPVKTNAEPPNPPMPMNQHTMTRGTGQFSPGHQTATKKFPTFDPNTTEKIGRRSEAPVGIGQDYSIPVSRPPVRMDHFPSSESEAYSDMSHILPRLAVIMNQPPLPPPVPKSEHPSKKLGKQATTAFPPTPMARTPSRDNPGLQPSGKVVPEISRPMTFPPPPPPPRQFRNNPNSGEYDDEYDDDTDDSDNWDIEFTPPGQSYA